MDISSGQAYCFALCWLMSLMAIDDSINKKRWGAFFFAIFASINLYFALIYKG